MIENPPSIFINTVAPLKRASDIPNPSDKSNEVPEKRFHNPLKLLDDALIEQDQIASVLLHLTVTVNVNEGIKLSESADRFVFSTEVENLLTTVTQVGVALTLLSGRGDGIASIKQQGLATGPAYRKTEEYQAKFTKLEKKVFDNYEDLFRLVAFPLLDTLHQLRVRLVTLKKDNPNKVWINLNDERTLRYLSAINKLHSTIQTTIKPELLSDTTKSYLESFNKKYASYQAEFDVLQTSANEAGHASVPPQQTADLTTKHPLEVKATQGEVSPKPEPATDPEITAKSKFTEAISSARSLREMLSNIREQMQSGALSDAERRSFQTYLEQLKGKIIAISKDSLFYSTADYGIGDSNFPSRQDTIRNFLREVLFDQTDSELTFIKKDDYSLKSGMNQLLKLFILFLNEDYYMNPEIRFLSPEMREANVRLALQDIKKLITE